MILFSLKLYLDLNSHPGAIDFSPRSFFRMINQKSIFLFLVATVTLGSSAHAMIPYAIDCMIHDAHGNMLADLGSVGTTMKGYVPVGNFSYANFKVTASLNGPFAETPEVKGDQLKLSFLKNDELHLVTAAAVVTVNENSAIALWEPTANLFLHCTKMQMSVR
jgi:hypothetical protein